MRRIVVLTLVLFAFVEPVAAQGGMGGRRGGGMGGMGGRRGGGGMEGRGGRGAELSLPDGGDLRKLSPAELIIDNRKKLALDQSQLNALAAMRDKAWNAVDPIIQHYDSVRKIVRKELANRRDRRQEEQPDSTRGEGMQAMRTMRFLVDSLSARRVADVNEVLDFLKDEKQHREAVRLLNDQDLTFQERLPRLGGGRGRRGDPDAPPALND